MQVQISQLLADAGAATALQEENRQLREALQRLTGHLPSAAPPDGTAGMPSSATVCGEQVDLLGAAANVDVHRLSADLTMLSVGSPDADWSGLKQAMRAAGFGSDADLSLPSRMGSDAPSRMGS